MNMNKIKFLAIMSAYVIVFALNLLFFVLPSISIGLYTHPFFHINLVLFLLPAVLFAINYFFLKKEFMELVITVFVCVSALFLFLII